MTFIERVKLCLLAAVAAAIAPAGAAVAQQAEAKAKPTEIFFNFTAPDETGSSPRAGLVRAPDGAFYGVASQGRNHSGLVFSLSPSGVQRVIYAFTGGSDGDTPYGDLMMDDRGFLYGTTYFGGDPECRCGTVFRLSTSGDLKTLYTFRKKGGANPSGRLAIDKDGNLYGAAGGSVDAPTETGVVFEIAKNGKAKILHRFKTYAAGSTPDGSSIVLDRHGNLYGVVSQGGASGNGGVFRIDAKGGYKLLHSFTSSEGANPNGGVVLDGDGNLYGATFSGGQKGAGTVYKMTPKGKVTVLASLGGAKGRNPTAALVLKSGDLYGATPRGGDAACDCGTVFKVTTKSKKLTVLHTFTGTPDGNAPSSGVVMSGGDLYGATFLGGASGYGAIYRVKD